MRTASPLTALLVAVIVVHCTATLARHVCYDRERQCQLRWGWASRPAPISLAWPRTARTYEPFFEHRRSNMWASITSIERPIKTTKLDLIAGILLIFVCDMLLLSFTF